MQPSMLALNPPSSSLHHDSPLSQLIGVKINHYDKSVTPKLTIGFKDLKRQLTEEKNIKKDVTPQISPVKNFGRS